MMMYPAESSLRLYSAGQIIILETWAKSERIFIELMTSDRELEASREGSK